MGMANTPPLVAIVDDDDAVRVSLRRLCSAYGLTPRTFATVYQLLDSIDDRRPDCLILDAQMPELGAIEAQEHLRARGISIPAIIITGRDDEELRMRAVSSGASAFLCKPIDAEVLMAAIDGAINGAPGSDGSDS